MIDQFLRSRWRRRLATVALLAIAATYYVLGFIVQPTDPLAATMKKFRKLPQSLQPDDDRLGPLLAHAAAESGVSIDVNWEALKGTDLTPASKVYYPSNSGSWDSILKSALRRSQPPRGSLFPVFDDAGTFHITTLAHRSAYLTERRYDFRTWLRDEREREKLLLPMARSYIEAPDITFVARNLGELRIENGWIVARQPPEGHERLREFTKMIYSSRKEPAVAGVERAMGAR